MLYGLAMTATVRENGGNDILDGGEGNDLRRSRKRYIYLMMVMDRIQ